MGRIRAQSDVSADLDLDDLENCVLCYNPMRFYILGPCNHKNVCINCALRVRILMEDSKCQICRADNLEVYVTQDPSMTWEKFEKLRKTKNNSILADREVDTIFYENKKCLNAGMALRARTCPMYECK
jgi:hypothetical protein